MGQVEQVQELENFATLCWDNALGCYQYYFEFKKGGQQKAVAVISETPHMFFVKIKDGLFSTIRKDELKVRV